MLRSEHSIPNVDQLRASELSTNVWPHDMGARYTELMDHIRTKALWVR